MLSVSTSSYLFHQPVSRASTQSIAANSLSSKPSPSTSSVLDEVEDDVDDLTYTTSALKQTNDSWAAYASATKSANNYADSMPTRAGFSSSALSAAVSDPGLETLSAGLSKAEVATAARSSIDNAYAAMAKSGTPFDINSPGGQDWYTAMGQLDRRALNAVSTNSGGLFTTQEQSIAQSIMSQQQGLAMGLYAGPTDQSSDFVDLYQQDDESARFQAGAAWLDQVSSDEKSTVSWAYSRASVQVSYARSNHSSVYDTSVMSTDPMVSLITKAMSTMKDNRSRSYSVGIVQTKADLLAQPWFQGFGGELNSLTHGDAATDVSG